MDRKDYLAHLELWIAPTYRWRAQLVVSDPPWHFYNYATDEPGQIHQRSRGANKPRVLNDYGVVSIMAGVTRCALAWRDKREREAA